MTNYVDSDQEDNGVGIAMGIFMMLIGTFFSFWLLALGVQPFVGLIILMAGFFLTVHFEGRYQRWKTNTRADQR